MTCNNVFGNSYHRTCRHSLLKPPRTSSLVIKPNVKVETVKIEVGGLDYLERKFFLKILITKFLLQEKADTFFSILC